MTSRRQGYFQVGGHDGQLVSPNSGRGYGQPHWASKDEEYLSKVIAGPDSPLRSKSDRSLPVELVLGIKSSGSWYILLSEDDAYCLRREVNVHPKNNRPKRAAEFESLSPIEFAAAEDLKSKLVLLKKRKNIVTPQDSSEESEGKRRAAFEHSRVFYRLVKGSLNNEKFALQRGILRQDTVRVCAFVYTIWSVKFDTRTATERLQIPKILHVAFAELSLPSFDLNKDTLQHYLVDKNAALVASAQKGDVQQKSPSEIGEQLSKLLSKDDKPIALLVYNREAALYALMSLGVDLNNSPGLKVLLTDDISEPRNSENRRRSLSPKFSIGSSQHRQPRTHDPRASLPGYAHHYAADDRNDHHDRRRSPARSPPRLSSQQQVSARTVLVDACANYFTMMTQIPDRLRHGPCAISGWMGVKPRGTEIGAALDLGVLVDCWKVMASGPSIDEQRAHWERLRQTRTAPSAPWLPPIEADESLPPQVENEDDWEEQDPNMYVPPPQAVRVEAPRPVNAHAAEYDPDDESDYYSSD